MDGTKLVADTLDLSNECVRLAFWLGRSMSEGICGPIRIENPGGSRSRVV
jgi:hypothetical protein